ncbi:osmotically-inducible protein OsmY [Oxalobacteraceae bacterium GrIS 1.18]
MNLDIDLQEKVMDALVWDPCVDATHVGVNAKGGIVTLSGYVASYFEKKKCERIAKNVAKVKAVVDELDLKLAGSALRADLDIAESAINLLKLNVLVPPNTVQLTVANAWVTLDGTVEWKFQRDAAEAALRTMVGIRGITNAIHVKPAARVGELKSKIQSALVRNAQIDARNITIGLAGDVVTLNGHVRSWVEKEQAEAATWSAPGITQVHNNIVVEHG